MQRISYIRMKRKVIKKEKAHRGIMLKKMGSKMPRKMGDDNATGRGRTMLEECGTKILNEK